MCVCVSFHEPVDEVNELCNFFNKKKIFLKKGGPIFYLCLQFGAVTKLLNYWC